jgi:hypothetical protein
MQKPYLSDEAPALKNQQHKKIARGKETQITNGKDRPQNGITIPQVKEPSVPRA